MTKSILSAVALILFAVGIYALSNMRPTDTVHKTRPHSMVYFKDDTTDLCFAYASGSVTYVPCTAEVEQAILEK